jgi:hypothetical protein
VTQAGYIGQHIDDSPPFEPGDKRSGYLGPFGLRFDEKWVHDDIRHPGQDNILYRPILETFESKDQRAIVVKNSWAKEDDPNGVLRWSDMTMSNWRNAAGDGVKDLKFIVRDNIQMITTVASDGTKLNTVKAIDEAFTRMKTPNSQTLVLTLNRSAGHEDELAAFKLMAAQTHVARVYQMLKDFRNVLGDLDIAKLHLTTEHNLVTPDQYNIVIELGPRIA